MFGAPNLQLGQRTRPVEVRWNLAHLSMKLALVSIRQNQTTPRERQGEHYGSCSNEPYGS